MYKDILLSIVGIDVFPVVSLLLFVIIFTVAVIQVARMDRGRVQRLAGLPLDDRDERERAGVISGRDR